MFGCKLIIGLLLFAYLKARSGNTESRRTFFLVISWITNTFTSLTAPFISVSVHSVEFLQINFPGGNLVVESDCHSHKLLNCVYRTGLSTKIVTTTNFSYYFVNHHSFKSEFCSVHAQNDKLRDSLPYLNLVVTSERRVLGLCKSFIRVAMSRNCDIYTCSHRLLDPFIISLKYQFLNYTNRWATVTAFTFITFHQSPSHQA